MPHNRFQTTAETTDQPFLGCQVKGTVPNTESSHGLGCPTSARSNHLHLDIGHRAILCEDICAIVQSLYFFFNTDTENQSQYWLCAMLSCSVVSDSATPWTVAHQAPLSMGILQTRMLEWVAMSSSRGSSQPRDWTLVSHLAGRFFIAQY